MFRTTPVTAVMSSHDIVDFYLGLGGPTLRRAGDMHLIGRLAFAAPDQLDVRALAAAKAALARVGGTDDHGVGREAVDRFRAGRASLTTVQL